METEEGGKMQKQKQAALEAMLAWLEDDQVLKQQPEVIECDKEFDLHNLHYYVFRFKEHEQDEWLLGVCGGYEKHDMEHCGHVFSRYLTYHEETAMEDAISIVEFIRDYWMKQAEDEIKKNDNLQDEEMDNSGNFNGFILMDTHEFDVMKVVAQLKKDWDITVDVSSGEDASENAIVFEVDDMLAAVSFMDAPVPDGEAEYFAQSNYFWKEACDTTKQHVSQILLAVLGHDKSAQEAGILFVKLASSAMRCGHALGIYTSGTVFHPQMYIDSAEIIREGGFPLTNLVYFGFYQDNDNISCYTYGMKAFHKEEMEILGAEMKVTDLLDFIYDIAYYVITSDVVLKDGETIGFSEEQKLLITYSKGVAVEGNSLKIHL